jgi:Bifunctional DNA primase/polymerase, N-terminal/Protein of unknown function (DUF3987)
VSHDLSLRTALNYAKRGWHIFPVHWPVDGKCSCGKVDCENKGKHPLTANGFKDATTDPKTITEWWTKWPSANIGLATGAVSGIVVVDIDNPEAKEELKKILPSDYDIGAVTRSATGRGWHLVYAHPGVEVKNRTGILPKVDVRGDGGYIIVEPSTHISGKQYKWQVPPVGELRKLPVELYKLITFSNVGNGHAKFDSSVVWEGIPDGQRDDELFRYACQLRSFNAPRDVTEELLVAAATRCKPPFPTDEALAKVAQAWKYQPGHSNGTANDRVGREQVTLEANENDSLPVTCSGEREQDAVTDSAFPEAAWTGLFTRWRDTVAPCTEASLEALWGAFLLAVGMVIGRSAWRESPRPLYPNFYLLLMGQTGDSRKSTVMWLACELLRRVGEDFKELDGVVSAEGIYEALKEREGTKGLVYADEFRALLSVAKRKGTQDILPRLNSLYYCPDRASIDRVKDSTVITRPFLSLVTATPQAYVEDILSDLEITGGFLNRFLIISGNEQEPKPIVKSPSAAAWGPIAAGLRQVRERTFGHLEMTAEATELWINFYTGWKKERREWHPKQANLSARTFEHVLKIAVVYSALAGEQQISVKSLAIAVAVGGWLQFNTLQLFADTGLDHFGKCERIILDILKRATDGRMWRRDLQQVVSKRGFNGEVFTRALKALESNDHVRCRPIKTPAGRERQIVEYIREQVTGKSAPDKGSSVTCSRKEQQNERI